MPTLTSAMTPGMWYPNSVMPCPNGISDSVVKAAATTTIGDAMYRSLSAEPGMRSSLRISFRESAIGWSKPCGPTRIGPRRLWMNASTLRSARTM